MEEININEIVKIEQMPKVFSQLEKIGELIDKKTSDLDKLECTDENKQIVKNRRTEINKTLEVLEERRKEIKNKLLEPYETFEEKYNNECKIKLQKASDLLKNKIDDIETKQKQEKQEEIEMFARQHFEANSIDDIVSFDDIGLNVTLSASMKSLKEQVLAFVDKINNDLKLINLEEYKDEILVEYKNNLDFTKSKLDVMTRHKMLEELQKKNQEQEIAKQEEQKMVEKVEEIITPPKEIIEDDEIIEVQFKVKGKLSKIKELKQWLKENEIEYE